MTTAAQVQAAFAPLFADAQLLALTDKAFGKPEQDVSELELSRLMYGQEVNFFTYLATRRESAGMSGQEEHAFPVVITYTLEKDPEAEHWEVVRTAFETLLARMKAVLGSDWNGTVDFWRLAEPLSAELESVTIEETECWRGRVTYAGTKRVSV